LRHPYLFVKIHATQNNNDYLCNLHLSWKHILISGCDVTLNEDSGVIVSPGYGRQTTYPNMVTCTWTIASKAAILLVFDSFTLGSGDKFKVSL